MRPISWIYATFALGLTLACIASAYRAELRWASRALPACIADGFVPLQEMVLFDRALQNLARGGENARSRVLLEQSLAIDPNSPALYMLGDMARADGHRNAALGWYQRFLEVDPAAGPAYLRIAELYAEAGEEDARRRILEKGVLQLSRALLESRPQLDPGASASENAKAQVEYERYRAELRALKAAL